MKSEITKEDITQIIDEAVSSRLSNQQATITFNLEDPDSERRLKDMLNVNKYQFTLHELNELFRKHLKYESGQKVRFKSRYNDEYKEIIPDSDTLEYIQDAFYQILHDNRINTDDLY